MIREPKRNHNVTYRCTYHVVWCPKYRLPVLRGEVRRDLLRMLRDVARDRRAEMLEVEVMPDHVQLVVEVNPQYGIHRLIKQMKGRSSRLLRQTYRSLRSRLPTLWTNSYFVATTGGAPRAVIRRYIEQHRHV